MSCSGQEKFIYYKNNSTVITRLNAEGDIYFYHGYYNNNETLPSSFIKASSLTSDGLIDGYLVFKESKVEVIRIEGNFQTHDKSNKMVLREMDNREFIKWQDSIKNYDNIVRFSDVIDVEKPRNIKTKINVKYN
jgi:hypothetical protein